MSSAPSGDAARSAGYSIITNTQPQGRLHLKSSDPVLRSGYPISVLPQTALKHGADAVDNAIREVVLENARLGTTHSRFKLVGSGWEGIVRDSTHSTATSYSLANERGNDKVARDNVAAAGQHPSSVRADFLRNIELAKGETTIGKGHLNRVQHQHIKDSLTHTETLLPFPQQTRPNRTPRLVTTTATSTSSIPTSSTHSKPTVSLPHSLRLILAHIQSHETKGKVVNSRRSHSRHSSFSQASSSAAAVTSSSPSELPTSNPSSSQSTLGTLNLSSLDWLQDRLSTPTSSFTSHHTQLSTQQEGLLSSTRFSRNTVITTEIGGNEGSLSKTHILTPESASVPPSSSSTSLPVDTNHPSKDQTSFERTTPIDLNPSSPQNTTSSNTTSTSLTPVENTSQRDRDTSRRHRKYQTRRLIDVLLRSGDVLFQQQSSAPQSKPSQHHPSHNPSQYQQHHTDPHDIHSSDLSLLHTSSSLISYSPPTHPTTNDTGNTTTTTGNDPPLPIVKVLAQDVLLSGAAKGRRVIWVDTRSRYAKNTGPGTSTMDADVSGLIGRAILLGGRETGGNGGEDGGTGGGGTGGGGRGRHGSLHDMSSLTLALPYSAMTSNNNTDHDCIWLGPRRSSSSSITFPTSTALSLSSPSLSSALSLPSSSPSPHPHPTRTNPTPSTSSLTDTLGSVNTETQADILSSAVRIGPVEVSSLIQAAGGPKAALVILRELIDDGKYYYVDNVRVYIYCITDYSYTCLGYY